MQSLSTIRALLSSRGIRPKYRLGQNFLHDHNQLRKLLLAAGVGSGDLVLEIGPGTGALTGALLDAGAEVVASEIDEDMASILEEEFADHLAGTGARLHLVRGDCLDDKHHLSRTILGVLASRPFTLVANLPYQAATPVMALLLTDHPECRGQFVTIQREVADRLRAVPSTKSYGPLSVITQLLGTVELISTLAPGCFWPAPEVTSAMIGIRPREARPPALSTPADTAAFAAFLSRLFSARRKQLGTTLGRDRVTWPAGVTPQMRPEALTPPQLLELWRAIDHPAPGAG